MAGYEDDDEDWVGEPPEGFYSRERADPGFWRGQRPVSVMAAGVALVLVVLLIVLLVG